MAEALLSGFLKGVFEKLTSPIMEELGLLCGLSNELGKLRSSLFTIQGVLHDAEERQVKDKAIRDWLEKLADVTYDADDLLDEYEARSLRRRLEFHSEMALHKVRNFFSLSNPLLFRFKFAHAIRKINERLDSIAADRFKFHLREEISDNGVEVVERRRTHSFVDELEVYGRADDKAKMVQFLKFMNHDETVSIIPIVGMGGLGKTTLAQLVYNDERVKSFFEIKIWVYVYHDFDLKRLIESIFKSIVGGKSDDMDMDLVQCRLREMLKGKRYLLVLDDVWNEEPEKWHSLKTILKECDPGSKIIVTTRSEKVAMIMGTLPTYHLEGLSDDDCWSLFKRRAFARGQEQEYPNLVAIGKEIVKKCSGVPLAAKALGSLMLFKRREREWLSIKESEIWELQEDDREILPALRLSYAHLPLHLKQCFAYCSLFPKDHKIKKNKLIQLWIAEGFIQSPRVNKVMEDLGCEYFDDLLWRSFFEAVKKDGDGNVTKCMMHHLVHDLARSVARTTCSTRHSSLVYDREGAILKKRKAIWNDKKLRTFLLFGIPSHVRVVCNDQFSFRRIRVLDLSGTIIKKLPASVGKLYHLRYLDLSRTCIKMLPETISNLHNLQTLKVKNCSELRELPKDMRKMVSLRHVEIGHFVSLDQIPIGIGSLSNLQSLPIFIVGEERGRGIEELKNLNLRGELCIRKLENVKNAIRAREVKLKEKRNLHSLGFSWEKDDNNTGIVNAEDVIKSLQPHMGLKKLCLENYKGAKLPSWIMDSLLPNLVEVSLIKCQRCQHLPPLAQLRYLRVLTLDGMENVKYIDTNETNHGDDTVEGFLSLEELTLKDMPNLEKWSKDKGPGRQAFPCLSKLTLKGCPKLISLPILPLTLKDITLVRSNEMLLRHVMSSTSLSSLHIGGFPGMMCLPNELLQNHTHLQYMKISDFLNLKSLATELEYHHSMRSLTIEHCNEVECLLIELQRITSLNSLRIFSCDSITALPAEGLKSLTSLNELYISDCNNLVSLPEEGLRGLNSLQKIWVRDCTNLVTLSEGIKYLTSLRCLNIHKCPNLVAMPKNMQYLTALQYLSIVDCPRLESLPKQMESFTSLQRLQIKYCPKLTSLPAGLQCITTLHYLSIRGCPHIEKQYEKRNSTKWNIIAHVSEIYINGRYIESPQAQM